VWARTLFNLALDYKALGKLKLENKVYEYVTVSISSKTMRKKERNKLI